MDAIFCNNCGAELDEAPTLLPDRRPPCSRTGGHPAPGAARWRGRSRPATSTTAVDKYDRSGKRGWKVVWEVKKT
jgi:hypothetical protein